MVVFESCIDVVISTLTQRCGLKVDMWLKLG